MSSARRSIGLALLVGLLLGAVAGGGVVLARGPVVFSTHDSRRPSGSTSLGAPAVELGGGTSSGPTTVGAGASGSAASGSAVSYPYPEYPGSAGLAPDHTIVVTGVGRSDLAADGSGGPAATKAATTAALADAKAQADLIAATVSDDGPIYAVPMAGGGSTPGAPVPPATGSAPLPQLSVAVTVAEPTCRSAASPWRTGRRPRPVSDRADTRSPSCGHRTQLRYRDVWLAGTANLESAGESWLSIRAATPDLPQVGAVLLPGATGG